MSPDTWKFVACLITIGISDHYSWARFQDPFVTIYVSLLVVFAFAWIFNWPKPEWFNAHWLDDVRQHWGDSRLNGARKGMQVYQLEEYPQVGHYFKALIYNDNTRKLCNDIVDGLVLKTVVYIMVLAGYLFLVTKSRPEKQDTFVIAFKVVIALASTVTPLIWDYAKCEKQRAWNRDVPKPRVNTAGSQSAGAH